MNEGGQIEAASAQSRQNKRGCKKFRKIVSNFDVLAAPFNFYLPDGNSEYKTTTGGVAFILFSILFGTYIFAGLIKFLSRSNYNLLELKF